MYTPIFALSDFENKLNIANNFYLAEKFDKAKRLYNDVLFDTLLMKSILPEDNFKDLVFEVKNALIYINELEISGKKGEEIFETGINNLRKSEDPDIIKHVNYVDNLNKIAKMISDTFVPKAVATKILLKEM